MDIDQVEDELGQWFEETIECNEDEDRQSDFITEKFEHGFFIRWGCKIGDFPRLVRSPLTDEIYIMGSGEIRCDGLCIADNDSKKDVDLEGIVWKFICDTQMKGYEKGYEQTVNCPDGIYKITVEREDG